MLRYMTFVWDSKNAGQGSAVEGLVARLRSIPDTWRIGLRLPGLIVLCAGERTGLKQLHVLQEQCGVVIGTIFERVTGFDPHRAPRQAEFNASTSMRIAASGARELVDGYWGSYVAIVRKPADHDSTWVLRAPTGTLPCLRATYRGIRLFFSYLPDCASLGVLGFSINWNFLARFLVKLTAGTQTGLNEVSTLPGGSCLQLSGAEETSKVYWQPGRICQSDRITDEQLAIETVRNTTKACINAWASQQDGVLLSLSGGLDSSIVLACLRDSPAASSTTCVTHYTDGVNSDERWVARLAAARAGCELIELKVEPEIDFAEGLRADISEAPQRYMPRIIFAAFERELAHSKNATAMFSGSRGDEVFLRNSRRIATDYLVDHGVDLQLLRILLHRCERENISLWRAAGQALRDGLFARNLDMVRERKRPHTLLAEDLFDNVQRQLAQLPGMGEADGRIPLGKQQQIFSLLEPAPYYLPLGQANDPVPLAPLASQPLIEACLRIPTYVLAHDGWDRAIARRAFAAELPPEVLQRRAKASLGDVATRILQHNTHFVRDLLLNGSLLRHQLLDRRKLEECLSDRPSGVSKGPAPLVRYLAAEMWLTIWSERGLRIAA